MRAPDRRGRTVRPNGGYRAAIRTATLGPMLLELGLLALTALSFWLLDRYVAGCEKI